MLPRHSIKTVLVATSVIGVCLFAAKNSDWISGVGLFGAFLLVIISRRLRKFNFHSSIHVTFSYLRRRRWVVYGI